MPSLLARNEPRTLGPMVRGRRSVTIVPQARGMAWRQLELCVTLCQCQRKKSKKNAPFLNFLNIFFLWKTPRNHGEYCRWKIICFMGPFFHQIIPSNTTPPNNTISLEGPTSSEELITKTSKIEQCAQSEEKGIFKNFFCNLWKLPRRGVGVQTPHPNI